MRKVLVITLIFLTSLFTSCERQDTPDLSSFDCADCFQQKPEYVRLNVKVTINDQNPYVLLKIYIGNYEDGQLDWKDTTY